MYPSYRVIEEFNGVYVVYYYRLSFITGLTLSASASRASEKEKETATRNELLLSMNRPSDLSG